MEEKDKRYRNPFIDLPTVEEQGTKQRHDDPDDPFGVKHVIKRKKKDELPGPISHQTEEEDEFGLSKIMEKEKTTTQKVKKEKRTADVHGDLGEQQEKDETQRQQKKKIKPETNEEEDSENKQQPRSVDVAQALQKIKPHLSKEKKFEKASGLLYQLMQAHLSEETADLFFDTIYESTLQAPGQDFYLRGGVRAPARALFDKLLRERDLFFLERQQYELETLRLRVAVAGDLRTDDTYQFSRAAKHLREALLAMDGAYDQAGGQRKAALLCCMDEAFKAYGFQWAKTAIESAFQVATEKRLLFQDQDRDRVDEFSTAIAKARARSSSGWVPRVARTHESTAHPLRNKGRDLMR